MTDTLLAEYITRLIDALSQTTEMSHTTCGISAFISEWIGKLGNLGSLGSLGSLGNLGSLCRPEKTLQDLIQN